MEMQGNATEIDERNLLQLDALLSHGYGLSPQLVMRSKGLSIEAKALYGYLSSFAGAGDTAFPSTSRILEELDISKNRFYKIRKELISWGFISIETTATSAGLRTVYTLPQNPIAIKTEIDEIANRRNEIKSSLVANLHNEDMVSHKGDSESERLQQSAGNEPCRQSEAKGYFATYSLGDFNIPIGSHVTAHAVPYTAGKAWRPAGSGNGKYSFKAGSDTPEYEEYTSTKELPQEVIDEMKTAVNQATNNK